MDGRTLVPVTSKVSQSAVLAQTRQHAGRPVITHDYEPCTALQNATAGIFHGKAKVLA